MAEKKQITERDRESTERRLLDTIGQMINENGFEKIGINAVATQSGVSKILIYRHFGSMEGPMAAYIQQHDFWMNCPLELPEREYLPDFLKKMFQEQITQLRNNPILKRLYRWELSSNNEMIVKLREQREKIGMQLVESVSKLIGYPKGEVAAIATILNSSKYLFLFLPMQSSLLHARILSPLIWNAALGMHLLQIKKLTAVFILIRQSEYNAM